MDIIEAYVLVKRSNLHPDVDDSEITPEEHKAQGFIEGYIAGQKEIITRLTKTDTQKS